MHVRNCREEKRVIERWDAVFRALAAEPRRQLVASLGDAGEDEEIELPDAAQSPAVPVNADRLHSDLSHRHLPLLAAEGYVEWTREPFVAWQGPEFGDIGAVLGLLQDRAPDLPDGLVEGCYRLEYERLQG